MRGVELVKMIIFNERCCSKKFDFQIIMHGSDLNSLHAFIPIGILPAEYGGKAGPFNNRSWHLQLLSLEDYFKDLETYGYKISDDLPSETEPDE